MVEYETTGYLITIEQASTLLNLLSERRLLQAKLLIKDLEPIRKKIIKKDQADEIIKEGFKE